MKRICLIFLAVSVLIQYAQRKGGDVQASKKWLQ